MRALVLIAVVTLVLSGCATKCSDQFYYKPSLYEQSSSFDFNDGVQLRFSPVDGVTVHLAECGFAYRKLFEPVSLCLKIIPEVDVYLKFANDDIEFLATNGQLISNEKINSLRYIVRCYSNRCTSILGSPAKGELKREKWPNMGNNDITEVQISPTFPFTGAEDSFGGYIAPRWAKLRSFEVKIKLPNVSNQEFLIQLPDIVIDHKAIKINRILFRPVREPICHTMV